MRRISVLITLVGLLVSLVSCDQGEEMEKPYNLPFDCLDLIIQDKDGNNVLNPATSRKNPEVKYDHEMMVIFQGDTLEEEGWRHKPASFAQNPERGSAWILKYVIRPGVLPNGKSDYNTHVYVLSINAVMMYYNRSYEFDVVSPRNKNSWHIRVEYETHTVAMYQDHIIRRCWVDGKRQPDRVINHNICNPYGITLPMSK